MAIGVVAILTIRRIGEEAAAWIDLRFAKLTTLKRLTLQRPGAQHRRTESLFETVASRISQTLHVPRVAVLLGVDFYKPAYAIWGY